MLGVFTLALNRTDAKNRFYISYKKLIKEVLTSFDAQINIVLDTDLKYLF